MITRLTNFLSYGNGALNSLAAILFLVCSPGSVALAGALENYVGRSDTNFNWKQTEQQRSDAGTVVHIEMISQHWRGQFWSHHLQIVRPAKIRNPDIAFLFITGDGDGLNYLGMLQTLAERAGAVAAVITKVPNQPLYDGRKEDALIAYSFDQYLKSGDETWPVLFPMVKSAVRGMDTVQAFAEKELHQKIERFVVSGASKRGWTTWLTAAADARVAAIAPMVIDMLNMKAQTQWAEKMYGKQSEQIKDYTDLNLIAQMDDPPMKRLREWVDPYSYRERYTMPKLLLLGTNDPYWVVDSLRHYWNDLPGPKLVFQTPNAGHDLGGGQEATQTLAAWFQMIADKQQLPKVTWRFEEGSDGGSRLSLRVDQEAKEVRLWTAESNDRDFRNDKWSSRPVRNESGSTQASVTIEKPSSGYRAFLGEVLLTSPTGHEYKLSTEARVTPEGIR
jgi:PhoPQ-activated pathogenicity-related protein